VSGFGLGGFGGDVPAVSAGAMTFGDILDAVCKDGIDVGKRGDAQKWVINRHAMLWGAAPWTFKQKTGTITFTADTQQAAIPDDVHAVYSIYDSQGLPLRGERDPRRFFDDYNTLLLPASGSPETYTIVDGAVLVGPIGDGSSGQIVYQMEKPILSADTDVTGLPDGFDLALVYGARATGYALNNIQALAGEYEQMFNAQVAALANDWLDVVLETGGQSGAYRPGARWPAFR
jgi:hypothetical protein